MGIISSFIRKAANETQKQQLAKSRVKIKFTSGGCNCGKTKNK
jgi:hypothetical protein